MLPRVTAFVLLACAGTALAQGGRLPDPPTPPPEPIYGAEKIALMPQFLEAYGRAARPRMLFYGDVQSKGGANKDLAEGGLVNALLARLEDLFRDPEVIIIDKGSAEALASSQAEALRRNDEFAAAKMLGEASKADVVVYLRLIEVPRAGGGIGYAASYVIADLRRGTSLGRYPWDMTPDPGAAGFDAYRIAEYARALSRRISVQFIEAFPASGSMAGMRRFTLRLVGEYAEDDLTGLRDALATSSGVKPGSVVLRSEERSNAQTMATLELAFSGDTMDLRRVARQAVTDRLGMEAQILDARDGGLELRLAPLGLTPRERLLVGGSETPRNLEARQQLASAYAKAGSPTIAVMVNRAAVETDESLAATPASDAKAPLQSGDGTNIVIADRVSVGSAALDAGLDGFTQRAIDRELSDRRQDRREQTAVDLRQLEDKLLERIVQLGLKPKDISAAQSELLKTAEPRAWDDRSLAFDLGKAAKAEIIVSAVGRLTRDRATGEPQRLTLTLRAFSTGSGDVLAATSIQRNLRDGESLSASLEEVSAEATGKLVSQLADRWAK